MLVACRTGITTEYCCTINVNVWRFRRLCQVCSYDIVIVRSFPLKFFVRLKMYTRKRLVIIINVRAKGYLDESVIKRTSPTLKLIDTCAHTFNASSTSTFRKKKKIFTRKCEERSDNSSIR